MIYSRKLSALLEGITSPFLPKLVTVHDRCNEVEIINDTELACSAYIYQYTNNKQDLLIEYLVLPAGRSVLCDGPQENIGVLFVAADITIDSSLVRRVGSTDIKILFLKGDHVTHQQLSDVSDTTKDTSNSNDGHSKPVAGRVKNTANTTKSSGRSSRRKLWEL